MAVRTSEKLSIDHTIPDDILIQVLLRLPVKSLMRFKGVCKQWLSHITHPYFTELYQSRRGLLLVIPPCNISTHPQTWDRRFYIIDCKKNPKHRATVLEDMSIPFTTNRVTNIVNGLICFYSIDGNESSISIYNLTTRENFLLPAPTCLSDYERKCYLGFDPINKEYKLLHKYWCKGIRMQCEVFTINGMDKTWRPIDINVNISSDYHIGFCHDGVIYWKGSKCIIAFNVEREEFERISYPPWEISISTSYYISQVGGYLSLVITPKTPYRYGRGPYTVEIVVTVWKLLGRGQDNVKPLWSEMVNTCPFENHVEGRVVCTDFGMVTLVTLSPKSDIAFVDCYDLKAGKHKVLKVNNVQVFLCPGYSKKLTSVFGFMPTLLVQNIMPLKNINSEERPVIG